VINIFFEILNLIQLELVFLFALFFVISLFWKKIYVSLSLKAYQSKQRLHQDEIPRIGGMVIYIFLILIALFSFESYLLNIILISAMPIIVIGAKEDLFHNTSPRLRLIFMIVSASLFIYLLPTNLPEINFPLLNKVLSFSVMKEIFFIFSILVIINGNNLIDGVNGNMALTNIVQLCVLALLAFNVSDIFITELCLILLIPLMVFLIFNFPYGKIFSGDAGAYFYGFSISASVIYLFGKYDQLLSWNAILILIYPSIELLFSFIRKKMFEKKSPLTPDAKHLHSIIFRHLSKNLNLTNNSFVVIYLLPLIIAPFLVYLYSDDFFSIIFYILIIFVYFIMMYLYFLNLIYKK
jgi:UDP-GlcNAc:undecaprenyl-phosphate/decaprenyl-phosphate GlcNAc-1-phosphate transferase